MKIMKEKLESIKRLGRKERMKSLKRMRKLKGLLRREELKVKALKEMEEIADIFIFLRDLKEKT